MIARRTLGAAFFAFTALSGAPAFAQVEIQWWHAMTGANNDVVVKLAEDFNASQKDYKVVVSYKGSYPDTMNAGIAAFRAGNAPHIIQVFEVGTATMMAAKGAVKPVYQLMAEANDPDCDPKKKSHVLRLCRATLRDFDLKREILTRVANHLDK